jgi:pantothenate synthetase
MLKQQCQLGVFQPDTMINLLKQFTIETEYLAWVSLPDMVPVNANNYKEHNQQALVFAGYLEGVRLIDNLVFEVVNS